MLAQFTMNQYYIQHRLFEGSWKSWDLKIGPSVHRPAKPSSPEVRRASTRHNTTSQTPKTASSSKPSKPSAKTTPIYTSTTINPSDHIPNSAEMAEQQLQNLIQSLQRALQSRDTKAPLPLLSQAKIGLLRLNALVPNPQVPRQHLLLAREILELGALASIRDKEPESFTRYYQQLQPFYSVPASELPRDRSNQSKITGLYLLLLLSQGDYAGFHTVLEALEMAAAQLDGDENIQYPIRLEQALMEGSYDRVWGETKGKNVPSEEFRIFSEVRTPQDFIILYMTLTSSPRF